MESVTKYDVRLVKESSSMYEYDKKAINNPQVVVKLLNEIFDLENRCEEHLVMLALDTKLKVVGAFDIHAGTAKASPVSTKSIFTTPYLLFFSLYSFTRLAFAARLPGFAFFA